MNAISKSILQILIEKISFNSRVIEIGSGSGHISIELSKNRSDLSITLNEIRKFALFISLIKSFFNNTYPRFIYKNILGSCDYEFDYAWNSGLINCFPPDIQSIFINDLLKISKNVLIFYPDINLKKISGLYHESHNIIGVDGCPEYQVNDCIFNNYNIVDIGSVPNSEDILGYPILYAAISRY